MNKDKDKHEKILDVTQKLMSQFPNQEISVDRIAKEAGISKGSIYYYFKSKEEIFDAVITRCYREAIREFFCELQTEETALSKIKLLFQIMLRDQFCVGQENIIRTLHLQEDARLHNQMKIVAIEEISPVLTALLQQGCAEGSLQTETPKESAEMIVAVLMFFFDKTVFPPEAGSTQKKLKIFARVLEASMCAASGSFDFLWGCTAIEDM